MAEFRLKYQILADGRQARAEMDGVDKYIDRLSKKGSSGLADVFGGNLASQAVSKLSASLYEGGKAVLEYSQNVESSRLAFESLMGNATAAAKHIKDLEALSRSTPLKFESIAGMSQRLQGAGVQASKVIELITDIGNVAAASGKLTEERMEGIGLAISQVFTKGKVSAEEMNQLAERGVPAWRILSQQLGKTTGELQKMAEKGEIGSDVMIKAFQTFSKQNYGSAMEKQAKTFSSAWQNIENIVMQSASRMFKPATDALAKFASDTAKSLKDQEKAFGQAGVSLGYALGESIGRGLREWKSSPGGQDLALLFSNPRMYFAQELGKFIVGAQKGLAPPPLLPKAIDYTSPRSPSEQRKRQQQATANAPASAISTASGNNDDTRRQREADQAEQRRISVLRTTYENWSDFYEATAAKDIAMAERWGATGEASADMVARSIDRITENVLNLRRTRLEEYISKLVEGTDEWAEAKHRLMILDLNIETQQATSAAAEATRSKERTEAAKKEHKERRESWAQMLDKMAKDQQKFDDEQERSALERLALSRRSYEAGTATAPGTIAGGIMGSLGVSLVPMFDEATNAMLTFRERMNLVRSDINDFVGGAIGGMIDGLTQMAVAWLTTGEFSGKAAMQMLASIALSIAGQAAIKAVFEAAEAVAAAARWDFIAAGLHATAATMYSSVAVIAAGAGVGLALGARAMGGGSKGSSSGSSASSGSSGRGQDANQTPISRRNENTFISRRNDETPAQRAMASAIEKLANKIDSMRPGDVVTVGAKQSPGAIAEATVQGVRTNSAYGTNLKRAMGDR